jgi:hypothetical protein
VKPTISAAVAFLVLLACTKALTGCSATRDCTTEADPTACLQDKYFGEPDETASLKRCSGSGAPFSPPRAQALTLYRGVDIGDDDVAFETRSAHAYYHEYGLDLTTTKEASPTELEYAIAGTRQELEEAGRIVPAEGNRAEELAARRVSDLMFGPVRSFIRSHSAPGTVQVVVLRNVASPGVLELIRENLGGTLAGIGLSPALLAYLGSDSSLSLQRQLALGESFTPTLFVGHEVVAGNSEGRLVLAHELGHALGLPHATSQGNLMASRPTGKLCEPMLEADQLARIASNQTLAPSADALDLHELSRRIVAKVNRLD